MLQMRRSAWLPSGFSRRLHSLDLLISDPFLGRRLGMESGHDLQVTARELDFHLEHLGSIWVRDDPVNCHAPIWHGVALVARIEGAVARKARGAGAATGGEIKVTKEMVESGEAAYYRSDLRFDSAGDIVARIYEAMERTRTDGLNDESPV